MRRIGHSEAGFSIVEVMVAATILLVGVLGTVSMVEGANRNTVTNDQRASGNALARDVIESARGVSYRSLSDGTLQTKLQALPGMGDADGATGWQIKRLNTVYTVTLTACAVDDPKDDAGSRDAAFGQFCPGTIAAGTKDTRPNDYSRVTAAVSWPLPGGQSATVRQTTLVNNTYRGPRVNAITTTGPQPPGITSGTSMTFSMTATPTPTRVEWFVDGKLNKTLAAGADFTWNLGSAYGGPPCIDPGTGSIPATSTVDGTYQIGAQAFDAYGSPGPTYQAVMVNRCAPLRVRGLLAGRTGVNNEIDLLWEKNVEDDVVGYRVYRSTTSATTGFGQINSGDCAGTLKNRDSCTDIDTPALQGRTIWYRVVAVDYQGRTTTEREGMVGTAVLVSTNNRPPGTPTIYNAGTYGTLFWYQVSDPDNGDTVDHYRIYRDGQLYDTYDYVAGPYVLWTDSAPTGTHTYRVSAVDNHLRASALSEPVTR